MVIAFLREMGIETVARSEVEGTLDNDGQGALDPATVFALGVRADHNDAEAIVLSCTDMGSVEVIAQLEATLGKPVISSIQAMMFEALQMTLRVLWHNDQTVELAAALRARHPEVECAECSIYDALPEMIDSFRPDVVYAVRFDGSADYPRDALFSDHCPHWVANGGAGTDHFGLWDDTSNTVTNAAGVAADMVAEYVMGGFLHFTLDVPGLQIDKAAKT